MEFKGCKRHELNKMETPTTSDSVTLTCMEYILFCLRYLISAPDVSP